MPRTHAPNAKVQPKHLLLELLLASGDDALPVSHAVAAGAVFGISENHVRVTLARLAAQGMAQATERGAWRLGPAAHRLAQDVANWRRAGARLRPWNGQYVAVHCGALARGDRAATRQRERALHLLGFAELQRDFWLRPDNIEADIAAIRARLRTLGLDPATLGRDDAEDSDRLVILRHTLMNPYLIDRENGISYIDLYFEHLARRVRALHGHA